MYYVKMINMATFVESYLSDFTFSYRDSEWNPTTDGSAAFESEADALEFVNSFKREIQQVAKTYHASIPLDFYVVATPESAFADLEDWQKENLKRVSNGEF